jgi:hypothetical protein
VTPELREAILLRDRMCFMVRLDPSHVCYDAFGREHLPTDLRLLTLEHVKDQPRMGRRAPSDERHIVALCYRANVGVPSKVTRQAMRAYLAAVGDDCGHVDPVFDCDSCQSRMVPA